MAVLVLMLMIYCKGSVSSEKTKNLSILISIGTELKQIAILMC